MARRQYRHDGGLIMGDPNPTRTSITSLTPASSAQTPDTTDRGACAFACVEHVDPCNPMAPALINRLAEEPTSLANPNTPPTNTRQVENEAEDVVMAPVPHYLDIAGTYSILPLAEVARHIGVVPKGLFARLREMKVLKTGRKGELDTSRNFPCRRYAGGRNYRFSQVMKEVPMKKGDALVHCLQPMVTLNGFIWLIKLLQEGQFDDIFSNDTDLRTTPGLLEFDEFRPLEDDEE
jgi:hypothetical protein